MSYSVGQVTGFAGVTVRALRHYDTIGLLCPRVRSAGGYRTRAASARCSPSGWARHLYGERRPLLGIQMVEMPSWSTAVAANRLSDVRTGHRSTVASAAYSAS